MALASRRVPVELQENSFEPNGLLSIGDESALDDFREQLQGNTPFVTRNVQLKKDEEDGAQGARGRVQ